MAICIECKSEDKFRFFLIPKTRTFICSDCFSTDKASSQKKSNNIRRFTRWVCRTHSCGSYNLNMMARHEMPWCDIITEATVGLRKPKTFGGMNGDVGRAYFEDWNEYVQRHDRNKHNIKVWEKYQKIHTPKVKGNADKFKRVSRSYRKTTKV